MGYIAVALINITLIGFACFALINTGSLWSMLILLFMVSYKTDAKANDGIK